MLPRERELSDRWLVDAAYFPGGRADHLFVPQTEGEAAAVLRVHGTVLPIGAQSSLTGGATPLGGALLASEGFDGLCIDPGARTATCGAGVPLSRVQEEAREHGLFLAPAPTYDGAFVGGAVATNAAGAATFKYGTMRAAVRGLTVILADGSVLELSRGDVTAHPDGWIDIALCSGDTVRVDVPTYRDPDVPKCSAGYFASPEMDLVDLFVGAEGTLGVVTEAVLALTPAPAAYLGCWLPVDDEARGLAIVAALREASRETWGTDDPNGLDVPSIEHFDRRSIELLIEDGADREQGVPLDPSDALILLFGLELRAPLTAEEAVDQLSDPGGPDAPLRRLMTLLGDAAERLEVALPGEARQVRRFAALREAVPMAVNHRVRDARLADPAVHKVGGDFIVPFDRLAESFAVYREEFTSRELDLAIWGHVGDGNVHPNAIPRTREDVQRGKEALFASGERVVALGGSPLAEHGVGRHPVKQVFLRTLRGDQGIREMRAVKRALDPLNRLAPGVLFPVEPA